MRIAVDTSRAFKQPRTGTERYAWEILRGLLAHPLASKDQWHLFVDREPHPDEVTALLDAQVDGGRGTAENVVWHVLPWRRMWTHRILGPAVRRVGVDVLFVPSHVIPFILPSLQSGKTLRVLKTRSVFMQKRLKLGTDFAEKRNPPTVVTIHDLGYRHWPETHPLAQRLYLEAGTRWNLRACAHAIAVSEATRRDIQAHYGTPAAKLHVIHEAAHTGAAPAEDAIAAARAEFDLPPAYAIFTGTLHPRKNVARLIQAYARLQDRATIDWPLVLAGAAGRHADRFQAQVVTQGLEHRIRFLGYVAQDTLPALMAGARFFVFPSLFEGFGLPVLEAQALGVPVMTSNYSSLPEVAGDAALYVDPTDVDAIADAMLRLSRDEELRARLIAAGFENVKRFSWEKAADETYEVLRQAAEGTR